MNKAEEIEALSAFAAALPVDSYLRGWLGSVLPYIISDIRSDIFPTATPSQTAERCAAMEKQAAEKCAELLASAEKKAAALVKRAEENADSIRRSFERERSSAYDAARGFLSALTR